MQINNSYTLRDISRITGGKCIGNIDSPISNVHYDSRRFVQNNEHVFLAFKTNFNDGHKYINQVYENGIKTGKWEYWYQDGTKRLEDIYEKSKNNNLFGNLVN